MKNIIFIAPPAAGKGTMSSMLSEEYNIPHISTGDLLREESLKDTPLGRKIKEKIEQGKFVNDEIMTELLINRLTKPDCDNGYILDGYPRNLKQAKIYEDILDKLDKELGLVIYLNIDKNLALKRMSGRVVCSNCSASYNLNNKELAPRKVGICDRCGHTLSARADDNESTFLERFDTYLNKTSELINYYNNKNVLKKVDILNDSTALDTYNKIKEMF